MLELEISREFVEVVSINSTDPLRGTIAIVGKDHLVILDRDDAEWFVPLSAIAFTLQH